MICGSVEELGEASGVYVLLTACLWDRNVGWLCEPSLLKYWPRSHRMESYLRSPKDES